MSPCGLNKLMTLWFATLVNHSPNSKAHKFFISYPMKFYMHSEDAANTNSISLVPFRAAVNLPQLCESKIDNFVFFGSRLSNVAFLKCYHAFLNHLRQHYLSPQTTGVTLLSKIQFQPTKTNKVYLHKSGSNTGILRKT